MHGCTPMVRSCWRSTSTLRSSKTASCSVAGVGVEVGCWSTRWWLGPGWNVGTAAPEASLAAGSTSVTSTAAVAAPVAAPAPAATAGGAEAVASCRAGMTGGRLSPRSGADRAASGMLRPRSATVAAAGAAAFRAASLWPASLPLPPPLLLILLPSLPPPVLGLSLPWPRLRSCIRREWCDGRPRCTCHEASGEQLSSSARPEGMLFLRLSPGQRVDGAP